MKPLPFVRPFFLNSDGTGAGAGYKLRTLEVGSETDKVTYKDPDGAEENLNPIILDALGGFDLYFTGNLKLRYLDPDDAVIWTIPNVEELGGGGGPLSIVSTMDDLKALGAGEFDQVMLAGYYESGDKDARLYTWDAASTATNNNGTVVIPDGHVGPGRWLMEHLGEVSTLDFGMKGDGVFDDLTTLTQALLYVQANDLTLVAPPSTAGLSYLIDSNSADFENGGEWKLKILPGASFTFTEPQEIGGIVEAGPHQWIADASAAVTFLETARFMSGPFPEWWGAVGDGSGDQLLKINSWLNCGASVLFIVGNVNTDYDVSAPPSIPAGITIIAGGQVSEGLTVHIAQGIHGSAGSTLNFDQVLAVDVTASGIVTGNLVRSVTNVQAGTDPAGGLLVQRIGTSTDDDSPAVSTQSSQVTDAATSGTGEDSLLSKTIEQNSLVEDGDSIRVTFGGSTTTLVGTPNTLTLRVKVGGTTLLTFVLKLESSVSTPDITAFHGQAIISKQAGNIRGSGFVNTNGQADPLTTNPFRYCTAAYGSIAMDMTSADRILLITGEFANTAGAEVLTQKHMQVEYIKTR
jgi:hypothetical protein